MRHFCLFHCVDISACGEKGMVGVTAGQLHRSRQHGSTIQLYQSHQIPSSLSLGLSKKCQFCLRMSLMKQQKLFHYILTFEYTCFILCDEMGRTHSWILPSASAFHLLQCAALVEEYEENLALHMHRWKGKSIYNLKFIIFCCLWMTVSSICFGCELNSSFLGLPFLFKE